MGVYRADGARLYYHTDGDGPPLVLIHGLGSSHQDWEYQVPAFGRHFRVIAPDLRGFGASDRAGEYSVPRFARDLWGLLDHLRVERPLLLGSSGRCCSAIRWAARWRCRWRWTGPAGCRGWCCPTPCRAFSPTPWPSAG
ncbi:MAG: alpha/beta fold hydrolase [Gammaproteobacteria bacterium]|nr:alpha/beta fold hydrolase [Gammaproteobacteria bacterium]